MYIKFSNYIFTLICVISLKEHYIDAASTSFSSSVKKATAMRDIDELYVEQLLSNLNMSVDPCEDFYAFACGNWSANYALKTEEYVDMPGYIDYKVNAQLLAALQARRNNEHQKLNGIYTKLWHFYQSCHELKDPALNHFLHALESELHMEWPIFRGNWSAAWKNDSDFDWLGTLAALRKYGLNGAFLTQHVSVRVTNGSHYLIALQQHQPTVHVLHVATIEAIFRNFGMSEDQSKNVSAKVMQLEKHLSNLTQRTYADDSLQTLEADTEETPSRSFRDSFEELTVAQLAMQLPQIDWRRYLELVLGRHVNQEKELVQCIQLDMGYFRELKDLLARTSNETIAYYLMLKLMYSLNAELPSGKNNTLTCVAQLRGDMPLAMNLLYEESYYKIKRPETDAAIMEIHNKLRQNFKRLLDSNYLNLTQQEHAYLMEELTTMRLKIGNVPNHVTEEFVEAFYSEITMNATNFYANKLQLLKFNARRELLKLLNTAIPEDLHFYEHNAATSTSSSPVKLFDNAILLPYGYLQLPFYVAELSALYQYSLLGFIIAHEIVHAFDLFHIVYDARGNYNETGYGIAQHFREFIECYVQSENHLLSETMADVSGLRLAYDTYFHDASVNSINTDFEQHSAKNVNFTSEQLFFVNSVQFLCANITRISNLDVTEIDLEHDMHDARVRKNWANFEAFAEAFHCDKDAAMNPKHRCRLW